MSIEDLPPALGWRVARVDATGSTNADLVQLAADGAADRTVLVADEQREGRGRLGRTWTAPRGAALLVSALFRLPSVPLQQRGWIGAVMGLAAVSAIARRTGLAARLKWPNDVLIDGRKVAGILAEMAGEALVVGMGLNVTVAARDLPRADATSLVLAGADRRACDRDRLLESLLTALGPLVDRWQAAGGDVQRAGIRAEYRARSATIGREVRVELPDGAAVDGRAVDVTAEGALVVDCATADGSGCVRRAFTAGDVRHLRPR